MKKSNFIKKKFFSILKKSFKLAAKFSNNQKNLDPTQKTFFEKKFQIIRKSFRETKKFDF